MKKIGRPRKSSTKQNISVNLPTSIIKTLEDRLSWGKSRSEWIEEAIRRKLDPMQSSTLREASLLQLLSVIRSRDISEHLRRMVDAEIEIIQAMLIAETEAEQ
tara:strand:- start:2079 stop:2387 length:309 start_codon:yes stop_codon:yes gene_type:complete